MAGSNKNLIVAGAGKLGCRAAEIWKTLYPEAKVFLKTRTANVERSAKWKAAGYESFSNEKDQDLKAPFVIFCAPPQDSYGEAALSIIKAHWDSNAQDSCYVFTSSGGVYSENSGGIVNEESSVKDTDYVKGILSAEKNTLDNGGNVIRFGGLYTLNGGAHNFWIASGKSPFSSAPNGIINLIHYEDGADAVVKLLQKGLRKQLFLLTDGVPISRINICRSALKHPKFEGFATPEFQGKESDGKKYDCTKFRQVISWEPKYPSYDAFMTGLYKNEKQCSLLN